LRPVEDAVGIDTEGDFDLRRAARGRWNTAELEHTQQAIVMRHGPVTLLHFDFHRRPVVGRRRKCLAFAGGNGGITLDQFGEYTAHGFDAER
jgi:hypothetical protein